MYRDAAIGDQRMQGPSAVRDFHRCRVRRGSALPVPVGEETTRNLDVFARIRDDYEHLMEYQVAYFVAN